MEEEQNFEDTAQDQQQVNNILPHINTVARMLTTIWWLAIISYQQKLEAATLING